MLKVRARLRTNLHALTIEEVVNKRYKLLEDLRDKVTANLRSELHARKTLPGRRSGLELPSWRIVRELVDAGGRVTRSPLHRH